MLPIDPSSSEQGIKVNSNCINHKHIYLMDNFCLEIGDVTIPTGRNEPLSMYLFKFEYQFTVKI